MADELLAMTTDLEGERRKSSGYDEKIALGKHFQGFYALLLREYIHTRLAPLKITVMHIVSLLGKVKLE